MDILVLSAIRKDGNHMNSKKNTNIKKEEIDNNIKIKELLKENNNTEEIASEISQNKKIADILGNRLASKNFFPPC
jgi:prophage antirepressor-like protein